jgi:hypothetical protein
MFARLIASVTALVAITAAGPPPSGAASVTTQCRSSCRQASTLCFREAGEERQTLWRNCGEGAGYGCLREVPAAGRAARRVCAAFQRGCMTCCHGGGSTGAAGCDGVDYSPVPGEFRALAERDPACVEECRRANCGPADPTSPASVFGDCTDRCTAVFDSCPALGQCFLKCDRARRTRAAKCAGDRHRCFHHQCAVVSSGVVPPNATLVVSYGCLRVCQAKRASCSAVQKPIETANRHCKEKCSRDCEPYRQFAGALQACFDVCDTNFDPSALNCAGNYETCAAKCNVTAP